MNSVYLLKDVLNVEKSNEKQANFIKFSHAFMHTDARAGANYYF